MRERKRPDVRKVYAQAWSDREALGTGDDVLTSRLREAGMDGLLEPEPNRVLFDLWRRGVPPRRLMWEMTKLGGSAAVGLADGFFAIYASFRDGLIEDEVHEGGRLTVRGDSRDDHTVTLCLDAGDATEALLAYARQARRQSLRGWRHAEVWLEMLPARSRARVMWRGQEVGQAEVPGEDWERMTTASDEGLYADGFLEVRAGRGGRLEVGDLVCWFLD